MKPSCLVKTLVYATVAVLSAQADILPPDSRLVPRTVSLINAEDYPGLVFVALEFYPGKTTPVAATPMGDGKEAKISGYKFDYIRIYAAKVADWPAVQANLAGPEWKSGLAPVAGNIDAASQYVSNSSSLKSETYEYKLEGVNAERLSLYAILQTNQDGSKKEALLGATEVRAPSYSAPAARLTADGRSLLWVPQHSGVATISLLDAAGRRAWSARCVATSGATQAMPMPTKMAPGKYLLAVQGLGWAQGAWLELGQR
jgi:hypothetical protein